ncbi:MAG TPA: peptidylprolyl isomerase, partial [Planctomycetota bacterium]|nr:peptidylprolyl isomerase [Planctomycetota bacterium]
GMLANKLQGPAQAFRAIDAGVNRPPAAAPTPQPRLARIGAGDELASFPPDVMMVVNGRPINRSLFDAIMTHMKVAGGAEPENMRAQRVLYDLVAIEVMSGAFAESEAEVGLGEVLAELDKGKTMQELAKKHGTLQGDPDGRVEVTRNSPLGPRLEYIAFETKPGTRAKPFRNARGIVLLQVDSLEKGATPDLDKVIGTAIQIPFSSDPATLARAQQNVNLAQMDIIVRDADVLAMLPQRWRQADPATVPLAVANDVSQLREVLVKVEAEIAKLASSTEAPAQEQRAVLEKQAAQIKEAIKRAETGTVDLVDETPKKPDPAPKKN